MNFLKKNWLEISTVLFILVFAGYSFYRPTPKTDLISLKCPHEYSDSGERVAAFKTFVDSYYGKNSNASVSELLDARRQFWVDHDCQEELKGYDDYLSGNLDETGQEKKKIIDKVIDDYETDFYK